MKELQITLRPSTVLPELKQTLDALLEEVQRALADPKNRDLDDMLFVVGTAAVRARMHVIEGIQATRRLRCEQGGRAA
jgi:hypothetical protein